MLAEWDDGRREPILFVVAVESDRRRFSPRRLAQCCLDLGEMLDTNRVLPVVVFLQPGAAPQPLLLGTERRTYMRSDFLACSLADMPAEDWLDSSNVVARVNLPNMRRLSGLHQGRRLKAVRGLFDLEPDPDRRVKHIDFIDSYAGLTENERRRYWEEHPEESSIMARLRVES